MSSPQPRRRCRTCPALLASDNRGQRCSACARQSAASDKASAPAEPPPGFWTRSDVQSALANRHFGMLLRAYRRAHDPEIRQAQVAEWLALGQGQISRIERSTKPVTDLVKLERWSRILRIPQQYLWFTFSSDSSDAYSMPETSSTVGAVNATTGDDVRRRQFLKSAGAGVVVVGAPLLPATPAASAAPQGGHRAPEDIRKMTAVFRDADNRFGGGHSRSALNTYLRTSVESTLNDTNLTGASRYALFAAAAELYQLAGWMSYDIGHTTAGKDHLRTALTICEDEIADDALAAEMLAAMSHHAAFQGDHAAVDLALAARPFATRSGLAALRAECSVMEAHGYALQNDQPACLAALHRAEKAFDQVTDAETPAWLRYFDSSYLAAKFAHAFRELGMARESERYARRSLHMSEGYDRGKLFNTALLASALADQRRIDEACTQGMAAVDMARDVRSVRATAYLSDLARRLAPFKATSVEVPRLYGAMDALGIRTPRV